MLQEPYATRGPQNEVRESWECGEVGRDMGRENKHGLVSAGKWKREQNKPKIETKTNRKKKGKWKERKEVEIRGTNMALLVAVAETSAEETTPHLEHLSVMP